MTEIATDPLPTDATSVCAYCGYKATHIVYTPNLQLAACCCDEPTHWAWLVAGIETEEATP